MPFRAIEIPHFVNNNVCGENGSLVEAGSPSL